MSDADCPKGPCALEPTHNTDNDADELREPTQLKLPLLEAQPAVVKTAPGKRSYPPLDPSEIHEDPDGSRYIFRATIRLRNGRLLRAEQCGKKAFKIPVS